MKTSERTTLFWSAAPVGTRGQRLIHPTAVLLLVVLLLNACYSFAPAGGDFAAPGKRVRVSLQRPQDVRFTNTTANSAVAITGELVSVDSQQVTLSAYLARSAAGYETFGNGETVIIPRDNIARVEENRLAALQTTGLVGGLVLLGILVGVALNSAGGGAPGPDGGGRPQ